MLDRITVEDIAEMARDVFRSHGYRCDGDGYVEQEADARGRATGTLKVTWDYEPATGMAAFSQHKVQPSVDFYVEALKGAELAEHDGFVLDDGVLENMAVRLHVYYQHFSGGRNGYSRNYVAKRFERRLVEIV